MRSLLLLAVAMLAGIAPAAPAPDRFGGLTERHTKPTGFFRVGELNGVSWLLTPAGNAFLSKGVCNANYEGDDCPALGYHPYGRLTASKYGSAGIWAKATAARLRGWGFNTAGAWCSLEMFRQQLPYAFLLDLAANSGANWQNGEVADVFSSRFREAVRSQASQLCRPRARDPFMIGYFTDNELRWGADWRSKKSLLESFLAAPNASPGKQAAIRAVRGRYATVDAFNQAWGTQLAKLDEIGKAPLPMESEAAKAAQRDFLRDYARAYFQACHDAIRAADRNHLILGCRFAGYAPDPVIEAMGPFVDVVSFNNYGDTPPASMLEKLHHITGRPVMITEFSFKAMDSGLPNTRGAGHPLATQQERADHFERFVTTLVGMPFVVGYHWFEYCDEPAQGRFDGENSNYGLIKIDDTPWPALTERMTQVNARVEQIHVGPSK